VESAGVFDRFANRQVIITLDKDFGELAVAFGRAQAGIVRLVDIRYMDQAALCVEMLALHGAELTQDAIVTAEPGRVRIRSAGTGNASPDAAHYAGCTAPG
jgi:predicted nuclease of predicted toxin-antitoxin system